MAATATVQNAQKGKNTVTIGGNGLAAMYEWAGEIPISPARQP